MVVEDDVIIGQEINAVPVTIDAAGASRVFSFATAGAMGERKVEMFNLSFINGMELNGGAFYAGEGEDVTCAWCVFENNTAVGDTPGQGGGAIFTAGAMTLMQTDLRNNNAVTGSGNGGAVLVAPTGSLSVIAGTFDGNVANRAGGAVENNGGSASFEGILFSNNVAGLDADTAAPGNGGAIHVSGDGTTMIQGGVAVGNLAFSEGGAFWNGSGRYDRRRRDHWRTRHR